MKPLILALISSALLAGCAAPSGAGGDSVYSSPGRPEPVYPPLPGTGAGIGVGAGGGRTGVGGGFGMSW